MCGRRFLSCLFWYLFSFPAAPYSQDQSYLISAPTLRNLEALLENYERETQLLRSSAHSLNTKLRFFEERSAELETMAKQSGSQLSAQRSLTRNLEQSLEQYAGSQLSLLAQKNGEAAAWQAEAAKKALEAAAYRGQRNVYLVLLIALGIGIIAGGIFVFLQKLRK